MPEPDDAPPQPADFVAWMSAEMPDVAASGRRIERRHLRLVASRPARWRSVRRLRASARRRGGDGARWLVAGLVLVLAGWGVVAIVHPFGLGRHTPSSAPTAPVEPTPVPSATPSAASVFPPEIAWPGHSATRVASVADPGCQPGPGVPNAFTQAVLYAGACRSIQVAEYVDDAAHIRMAVAAIDMFDPTATIEIPLRISEFLVGPALLAAPASRTIFAGAASCGTALGLVGSAAAVTGARVDLQAMASETADLMRALAGTCAVTPT